MPPSTTTPNDEPSEREDEPVELDDEEEEWLDRRVEASLAAEREGRRIPHEALFPPRRKAG